MSWLSRLAALFRKRKLDAELDDELRFHLEMEEQQNLRSGMGPAEARRQARLRLGGVEQVKEEYRERRGIPFVEAVWQDLRLAVRSLRRSPGLTVAILLTLTIGIGVATAIFSIVDAVLINPLPYQEPDRLVMAWGVNEEAGYSLQRLRTSNRSLSPPELADWRSQSGVFDELAGFASWAGVYQQEGGPPEQISGVMVTPGVFDMLGVQPTLGHGFLAEEEEPGGQRAVVLQHRLWQRLFRGDRNVIGRTIRLERNEQIRAYRVAGVMPPGFVFFSREVELFTPMEQRFLNFPRRSRAYRAMGRLAVGLTLEQAQARANLFSENLAREHPDDNKGWRVELVPLSEESSGEIRPAVLLLGGALVAVLLIMCANVANLLLVRATARSRQVAVQAALGAGIFRLVRQFVVESVALSLTGAAAGLLIAYAMVGWFRTLLPDGSTWGRFLLQAEALEVDGMVIGFAVSSALLAGLVFALIPAMQIARRPCDKLLRDAGKASTGGRRTNTLRSALVVSEVALAAVLVVCAGLLVRSFAMLYSQGPGFRGERTLAVSVAIPAGRINSEIDSLGVNTEERGRVLQSYNRSFRERMLADLKAVPGVADVAKGSTQIMDGFYGTVRLSAGGRRHSGKDDPFQAVYTGVTDNYFSVMGIPLLRGRTFGPQDRPDGPRVAVISESTARALWPGEDPLGKQFHIGSRPWQVVGVCGDVREDGLEKPPTPFMYGALRQSPDAYGSGYYLVSSAVEPTSLIPAIRAVVRSVDPGAVVRHVRTMESFARDSAWRINYSTALLGGLAGLAFLLAMIGVFGVLSYSVRERSREIGVRMALGARREQVVSHVVLRGVGLAWVGLLAGLAAALVVTRILRGLLFGIEPTDPFTFAAVAVGLTCASVLASYWPARYATRVDPVIVLRHE